MITDMRGKKHYKKLSILIFIASLSTLCFEINLTRIFQVTLSYHFAFMIISIAMLGIGASGSFIYIFKRSANINNISLYALFLSLSIFFGYTVTNNIPFNFVNSLWGEKQILYLLIYYVILSLPFFFTGLIVATSLCVLPERSHLLYFADLIGAGFGALLIISFLSRINPEYTILTVSLVSLFGAFFASNPKYYVYIIIISFTYVIIFYCCPEIIKIKIPENKDLNIALSYPNSKLFDTYFSPYTMVDTFKSSYIRFAPGLSLKYMEVLPEQIGLSIGAGDITAITNARDRAPLEFLEYLPSSLIYFISNNDDVFVVDPGGGLPALMAKYFGSDNIYIAESNPLIIEIVKNIFGEFSGNIYEKNVFAGMGRSWIKSSNKLFDLIDISLMEVAPSSNLTISEDYRFTTQAFNDYINHLNNNGFISINLHLLPPPRIELRILNTIIRSMKQLKIKNPENHIAAIRSWSTMSILIKKTPISPSDIKKIREFSDLLFFDLVYYPKMKKSEANRYIKMDSPVYYTAFKNIIDSKLNRRFVNDYIFNIKPVYDDKPFFNYFIKMERLKEIYNVTGKKWQFFIEEGFITYIVFFQMLILTLILIFLPTIFRFKIKNISATSGITPIIQLPYFAFIGIGFMFVEVILIQKFILALEHPFYAFSTILMSLLISSGVGSLLSIKMKKKCSSIIIFILSIVIILYLPITKIISNGILLLPINYKVIIIFLIIFPLGILMGMPFPYGIRLFGVKNKSLIPWAWCVNGCFSVLSPPAAVILALNTGFNNVLMIGAVSYLAAFINILFYFYITNDNRYHRHIE